MEDIMDLNTSLNTGLVIYGMLNLVTVIAMFSYLSSLHRHTLLF
jgi:hypothetical protein